MSVYNHRPEGNARPIFTNVPGRGTRTYVAQVETYVKEVRRPKYTVIPVKMDTSTERGIVKHNRPREVDDLISKILTEVNGSPASYTDLSYTDPGRGSQWGEHIIPVKVKTRDDYGTDHRYGASPPKMDTMSNYRVEYEYGLSPRKPEIRRNYGKQWDDYDQPFKGDYGDRSSKWGNSDMKSEAPRDYGGPVSGNMSSSLIYGQPWQRDNQISDNPYQEYGDSDNLSPKKSVSPRSYRVNDDQQGNNPMKAKTRYQYAADPTLMKPDNSKNRSPNDERGGSPLSFEASMDNPAHTNPFSKSARNVYEDKPHNQSPRKGVSSLSPEALRDNIVPNIPWSKSSGHVYGYDYMPDSQSPRKGGSSLSSEALRDNRIPDNSWNKPSSHVYDLPPDNQSPKKHGSLMDNEASQIRQGYQPVKRAPIDYGAPNNELHHSSPPSYDHSSANPPPLKSKTLTDHGIPYNRWSPLSPEASRDNKVSNNPWKKSSSNVHDYMPDNQSPKKYGSPMDSELYENRRGYQPFSRDSVDYGAPNKTLHYPSPSDDPVNQSLIKLETPKDLKVHSSGWSPLNLEASTNNRVSGNPWNKSSGHALDLMPDNQPKKYGSPADNEISRNRQGYQPISQAPIDYGDPNNKSHRSSPPSYGHAPANQTHLKSETPKDLKVANNNRWSPSSLGVPRDNLVSKNPWSKSSDPVHDYMPDNQSPKKDVHDYVPDNQSPKQYGSRMGNEVFDRQGFQPISRAPFDYGAPNNLQQSSSPSPSYDHSPTNDPPLKSEAPIDQKVPNNGGGTIDNYNRFSNIKPLNNRWGSSYNPPLEKAQLPTKLQTTSSSDNLSNQPIKLPYQPPNNIGSSLSSKKQPPLKSEPQMDHNNAPKNNHENSKKATQPNHWNGLSSPLYDHQSPRIDTKQHQPSSPRAPLNPYSEQKADNDNFSLSKPKTYPDDRPPMNYGGTNEKPSGSFKTSPPSQIADPKGNVSDNISEATGQLSASPKGVPEDGARGSYVPGKSRFLVPPPVTVVPKQDKAKGFEDMHTRNVAERYSGNDFRTRGSSDGDGNKTITCKEAVQKYNGLAVPK